MATCFEWVGLVANVATAAGIGFAAWTVWSTKRKDDQEQARNAYASANDRYLEYLRLCLDYPAANAFDETFPIDETDAGKYQRSVIFAVLVSSMEAAHVSYRMTNDGARANQWKGWDEYIQQWVKDERFRSWWEELGAQYDADFLTYMNRLIDTEVSQSKGGSRR